MQPFGLQVIESSELAPDEAWIIFKADAPQVPQELRGSVPVPCILTGDVEQAKRTLKLLQAISLRTGKAE